METQPRLSRHNKSISVENITILSVSSDDYLHASLSLSHYIYIYICMCVCVYVCVCTYLFHHVRSYLLRIYLSIYLSIAVNLSIYLSARVIQ